MLGIPDPMVRCQQAAERLQMRLQAALAEDSYNGAQNRWVARMELGALEEIYNAGGLKDASLAMMTERMRVEQKIISHQIPIGDECLPHS